jgi:hypothetical protein
MAELRDIYILWQKRQGADETSWEHGAGEHHEQDSPSDVGSHFHAKQNVTAIAKIQLFVTKKFNIP